MWWQSIPSFSLYVGFFFVGCSVNHGLRRVLVEKDGLRSWEYFSHNRLFYLRDHSKNGTIYKTVGLEALEG